MIDLLLSFGSFPTKLYNIVIFPGDNAGPAASAAVRPRMGTIDMIAEIVGEIFKIFLRLKRNEDFSRNRFLDSNPVLGPYLAFGALSQKTCSTVTKSCENCDSVRYGKRLYKTQCTNIMISFDETPILCLYKDVWRKIR